MSAVQSYLSGTEARAALVQARMQELKAKEVHDKEAAERLEAERLAALQLAVEAASIDWEAELLLAAEKVPLSTVRSFVLGDIQKWCRYPSTYLPHPPMRHVRPLPSASIDPIPAPQPHPRAGMLYGSDLPCAHSGRELHHTTCSCSLCVLTNAQCPRAAPRVAQSCGQTPRSHTHLTITGIVELATVLHESCNLAKGLQAIQQGLEEDHIPKEYSLVNERARLRIRVLTGLFHSFQKRARTEVAEEARMAAAKAAAEARMAAAKAAEEARIVAEKAAAAMEEQRVRMNAIVAKAFADHPNFRIIQHNYTGYGAPREPPLFASYKECKKTGRRWLHVQRLAMGQIQEAFVRPAMCDFSSSHGSAPSLVVPESWADHYETGKTPFLTICPVCKKAPKMHPTETNYMQYTGGQVECTEHYKWEPSTNTHYKWALMPPPPPPSASAHPVYGRLPPGAPLVATIPYPSGHWVLWDPKDPDGAKAAHAAKEKKIAETKAEIQRLMATLD